MLPYISLLLLASLVCPLGSLYLQYTLSDSLHISNLLCGGSESSSLLGMNSAGSIFASWIWQEVVFELFAGTEIDNLEMSK